MSVATDLRGNVTHLEARVNLLRILEIYQEYNALCATRVNTPEQVMRLEQGLSHHHYRARKDYFWSGGGSVVGSPTGWSSGLATGLTSGWPAPGLARYRNSGALAERIIVSCWLKNFW